MVERIVTSQNSRLLRALIGDLIELADNLDMLEDAAHSAPRGDYVNVKTGRHSDQTLSVVDNDRLRSARDHYRQAEKRIRGPLVSFMGRLKNEKVHYHVHEGMKALSKGPDQRARHEAGEAPSKESA